MLFGLEAILSVKKIDIGQKLFLPTLFPLCTFETLFHIEEKGSIVF